MNTISKKEVIIEIFVWILSAFAAFAVFFPIVSKIDYKFFYFQFFVLILGIQFFRWTVFFDKNILFTHSYVKFFAMIILSVFAFMVLDRLQAILLILEDQDLSQIAIGIYSQQGFMSLPQVYSFFQYLFQTILFGGYTSVAMAVILVFRILAGYFGWRSRKMKEYIIPKTQ